MGFHDHFSSAASEYASFRPRYPSALFAALAPLAPARRHALDCGTGSGQAAVGLAEHFDRVTATDASREQIAAAIPHPRVEYAVRPAESSGLEDGSCDLVSVAQAIHWFDRPAFYDEAKRILAPDGVLAVWCYELMEIDPEIDRRVLVFYKDEIGPYWPPERLLVESGYRTIDFPFDELPVPPMAIEARFSLADLTGYLGTWSAVIRYREAIGVDPVERLARDLAPHWGDPKTRKVVRWPLSFRVGRTRGD